jgi:hypothetical protein
MHYGKKDRTSHHPVLGAVEPATDQLGGGFDARRAQEALEVFQELLADQQEDLKGRLRQAPGSEALLSII